MPIVARPGCPIHYSIVGSGPPLVLVPGFGETADGWADLLPLLAQSYTCLLIDNRGGGLSGRPSGFWSSSTMGDDIAAVLDDAGIATAHILGNSLGGVVAQQFAYRHPDRLRSLILLETSPGVISFPPSLPRLLWDALRNTLRQFGWMARPQPSRLTPAPPAITFSDPPGAPPQRFRQVIATLTFAGVLERRVLKVPTLIVHGTADALIPASNARLNHRLIRGSRLVWVRGAGHLVIGDNVGAVATAVTGFLAEQTPGNKERLVA